MLLNGFRRPDSFIAKFSNRLILRDRVLSTEMNIELFPKISSALDSWAKVLVEAAVHVKTQLCLCEVVDLVPEPVCIRLKITVRFDGRSVDVLEPAVSI